MSASRELQGGAAEPGGRPFARWSAEAEPPPAHAFSWLAHRLGDLTPSPEVPPDEIELPATALPVPTRDGLRRIVGDQHVDDTPTGRLSCAGGQSYSDLIRRRSGAAVAAPDAVVRPATHDEVLAVLALCSEHRVAVVPYGGGTSVVGGVEPQRNRHYAVVTLDLRRMDRMLAVDAVSQVAVFGAGVTGPRAEELLAPHGLTLGHLPQSYERATLGGYAATRSAGQASTGYGRFDDLLVALRVATPVGELALGTGTPNAAGPDLRGLFSGSEGTLGVLTEVTVRVRPKPPEQRFEMWALPSFEAGLGALRSMIQEDAAADVVRLSDESETEVTQQLAGIKGKAAGLFARARGARSPAFCVVGWDGTKGSIKRRRERTVEVLRRANAVRIGEQAGETWRRHRFAGPRQRDQLLDAGVMVETLETATAWSQLGELYAAVRAALSQALDQQGTPPIVMTHASHLYPTGASLYFTVLARRQAGGPEATLAQWAVAKAAACEAILAQGGTITHHHGIGRDHVPYLPTEIGKLGVALLAAAKQTLDPYDILNPGVLLPPTPSGVMRNASQS
ncbi:FAD-binding oxidoreductase [Flindersiella endophytica]